MRRAAAVLLACLALIAGAAPAGADDALISAPEALRAAQRGELLLLDIRTPEEWRRTGLPAHARRATIHGPDGMDGFLRAVLKLTNGDRTRPIALICAAGVRSARARAYLVRHGFTRVRDVAEGMEGHGAFAAPDRRGWLRRDMPVEPCGACADAAPGGR